MVQTRAHSEFLLASGTANPTGTSALCSCFCSRVGQSKHVSAKASTSTLPLLTNHLSSSISMQRMGWTCWQSSRYCLQTPLSCQSSCSWETVGDCASCHHPITPRQGPHDGWRGATPRQEKQNKGCLRLLSSPSTVVPSDPPLRLTSHPSSPRAGIPHLSVIIFLHKLPNSSLCPSQSLRQIAGTWGRCLSRAGKRILDCTTPPYLLSQAHETVILFKHPRPKTHRHAQGNEGVRTTTVSEWQYWRLRGHWLQMIVRWFITLT